MPSNGQLLWGRQAQSRTPGNQQETGGGIKDLLEIIEAPWANSRDFILDTIVLVAIACVMGLFSHGYMKLVGDFTVHWLNSTSEYDYPNDPESVKFLHGAPIWILICWGGGTVVGLLKVLFRLDQYPSFLEDLIQQKVDPVNAMKVLICCVVSLISGAAMGPEAGLGAAGGALGTVAADLLCKRRLHDTEESRRERQSLYTLAGITAAFGAIFPAPWVALLLVMELSARKYDPAGKSKIALGNRQIYTFGLVGSLSWFVCYLADPESASATPLPGSELDLKFNAWMPAKAVLLGLGSIVAVLVYFVIAAICKRSFKALGAKIEKVGGESARILVNASLAGLITGLLGFAVPLSLTDGASQMKTTARIGANKDVNAEAFLFVAVCKCFAYWVAASGGLVGGIFFPLIYIGLLLGEAVGRIPGMEGAFFTVPVMMASMAGAFMPVPLTLVAMPLSSFNLGPKWCVLVLIGIVTSYTGLGASGLLGKLLEKANGRG